MNDSFIKLYPTSALVMRMSKESYLDPISLKYYQALDLSLSDDLFNKCSRVCDWYSEILLNRKHLIYKHITQCLKESAHTYQIIILAAGICPLSLRLLYENKSKISHIFEIDQNGMSDKRSLIQNLFPHHSSYFSFISSSVDSESLKKNLFNHPLYQKEKPSIILMEGLSYYIDKPMLNGIIETLQSPNQHNLLIVEYLKENFSSRIDYTNIVKGIFNVVTDSCGLSFITRYSYDEISTFFKKISAKNIIGETLTDAEKSRTGKNKYFPNIDDGWINFIKGFI